MPYIVQNSNCLNRGILDFNSNPKSRNFAYMNPRSVGTEDRRYGAISVLTEDLEAKVSQTEDEPNQTDYGTIRKGVI